MLLRRGRKTTISVVDDSTGISRLVTVDSFNIFSASRGVMDSSGKVIDISGVTDSFINGDGVKDLEIFTIGIVVITV